MTIYKVTARHELTKKPLAEMTIVGQEKDADSALERLMVRYPDADVLYTEVEEEVGTVRLVGHPLDGLLASLVSEEDDQVRVRVLESRGVFTAGHVVSFAKSEWVRV